MLAASLAAAALVLASVTPLAGRVVDQSDQPVVGAVVRVSTGKPRQGPRMTCPSCYADCGKVAVTDGDGHFKIDDVSEKLLFGLAVGAYGHQGQLLDDVDPLQSNLELSVTRLKTVPPDKTLTGRVVDLNGQHVSGATVTVGAVAYQSGRLGGPNQDITPATVTDSEGNFTLTVNAPIRQLTLKVRAPGFAPIDVNTMRAGRDNPPIKIGPGASLMGRLVRDGKPVGGLALEVFQKDRQMGKLLTPTQITTAKDGTFRLDQLPAGRDYVIYSLIGQAHPAAIPVTVASVPKSGMLADLGDIPVEASHRLTVRFQTNDGQPIPDRSYCYLSRKHAWHSARSVIPADSGAAVLFEGVATEVIALGIRVPGYDVVDSEPFCQVDLNRKLNLYSDTDQSITVTLTKAGK